MSVRARTVILAACLAAGCRGGDKTRGSAETPPAGDAAPTPVATRPLELLDAYVDVARAPRGDRPFIAGEAIQVGLRVRGGTPPYKIRVTSQGSEQDGKRAIDASAETKPSQTDAVGVELVARTLINPRAPSGTIRLGFTAIDAVGGRAITTVDDVPLLGDGAPVIAPAPAKRGSTLRLLDAGGRERTSFHRGEIVELAAELTARDAGGAVTVQITDDAKAVLAPARQYAPRGRRLEISLPIPRLARAGIYHVTATGKRSRMTARLRIDGEPFPPVANLVIDDLSITGGTDGRAPRAGAFRAGEHIVIEARVGGANAQVTGVVRLRDGDTVHEKTFAVVPVSDHRPDARVYVRGSWKLPAALSKPRQRIEIEVTEDDRVSTRYREALIQ